MKITRSSPAETPSARCFVLLSTLLCEGKARNVINPILSIEWLEKTCRAFKKPLKVTPVAFGFVIRSTKAASISQRWTNFLKISKFSKIVKFASMIFFSIFQKTKIPSSKIILRSGIDNNDNATHQYLLCFHFYDFWGLRFFYSKKT